MSITHILTTNHRAQAYVSLLMADMLVGCLVNPRQASAPWLIVGFILLALTVVSAFTLVARSLRLYGAGVEAVGRRLLRYAAIAIVAMIGLQSIGQLTVKDVAALLPFAILTYLYVSYGKTSAADQVR